MRIGVYQRFILVPLRGRIIRLEEMEETLVMITRLETQLDQIREYLPASGLHLRRVERWNGLPDGTPFPSGKGAGG